MEKFWAVILIFVVVAAAGLMYVNQVYNPQKQTQMAMADMATETLSAVRTEIGDNSTRTFVDADDVIEEVEEICNSTNSTVTITVIVGDDSKEYTNNSTGIEGHVSSATNQFVRTSEYEDGKLKSIKFEELDL